MTNLDQQYKAHAWANSYNHHLDMVDMWRDNAWAMPWKRNEYLKLAQMHSDEATRLIGDIVHGGWEVETIDDAGHIVIAGRWVA